MCLVLSGGDGATDSPSSFPPFFSLPDSLSPLWKIGCL